MGESDEMICSEVHTFTANFSEDESSTKISKFRFTNPLRKVSGACQQEKEVEYDSDGDIVVVRSQNELTEDTLVIEHDLFTPLVSVGRQVWRGSLLLADYLLQYNQKMTESDILEIGSGTGLTSIVAAMCGARVTSTDISNQSILETIQTNINHNKALLPLSNPITVKPLDIKVNECDSKYDYILAGDIIYDDDITDAFVKFISTTLDNYTQTAFLVSLEKRFVFTVKDLDTVAPAYQYFIHKLQTIDVSIRYLDIHFKQYFCYDRSKDMVLMEIKSFQ